MTTWHYHYTGIHIASDLELPEWANFAVPAADHAADVTIRCAPPIPATACATHQLGVAGECLTFQLPQIGRYAVTAGHEITVTPGQDVAASDLRLFLLGSAWGAVSYQRGWFPLHASVVRLDNGAVAFCAPSGGGKSSLAAWLGKLGYPLLSDDLCRLDVTPAQIWPTMTRLKLWRDALVALEWQHQPRIRDQRRVDKFHLPAPAGQESAWAATQPVPLRAIYQLTWGELAIRPLHGLQAVRAVLTAATYRPEFVDLLGQTAAYWQQAITLVSQVPVFQLQRPRDWDAMPAAAALLTAQVQTQ